MINPSKEVVKAGLRQPGTPALNSQLAADATLAIHDDGHGGIQQLDFFQELRHGDERTADVKKLVLIGFAYINELKSFTVVFPGFEFCQGKLSQGMDGLSLLQIIPE